MGSFCCEKEKGAATSGRRRQQQRCRACAQLAAHIIERIKPAFRNMVAIPHNAGARTNHCEIERTLVRICLRRLLAELMRRAAMVMREPATGMAIVLRVRRVGDRLCILRKRNGADESNGAYGQRRGQAGSSQHMLLPFAQSIGRPKIADHV